MALSMLNALTKTKIAYSSVIANDGNRKRQGDISWL